MKRKNKILLCVVATILIISLLTFSAVYFLFLHRYKGTQKTNIWSETDAFDIQNIKTVEKKNDKDFVIMNLADVQMCDLDDFFNMNIIKKEITYLVEQIKPDLITLTGDQTWSNENLLSLTSLLSWLDSFKIPYAPVFGNHDYGNEKNSAVLSQNACCDLYERGKYSLFDRGPSNLGTLGNYVINITENGKIIKTLYMLDSGYENMITDEQISWFKWNANGIKEANGGTYSEGMCFMHKPLPEYYYAYKDYIYGDVTAEGNVYVSYSLSGSLQNGFFAALKEKNVKDVVCGHQHGNNFTLKYENVRLTFALKTGELGGFYNDGTVNLNGASYFIFNQNETKISNFYVPQGLFTIKNSDNVFLD